MLSHFSIATIDSLLEFQNARGITGDVLEIGVFRGKSAAVLARRMAKTETLHLYDISDQLDRARLAAIGVPSKYSIVDSAELKKRDLAELRRAMRFCHIDASHRFEATIYELSIADYVLADDGIVSLDDYANLNYSQILAATFKYLFTRHTDLTIFLVTQEKAYLCRKAMFDTYALFVLDHLQKAMADRAVPETCLAKTDEAREYRAFHLRRRQPGEGDRYSEQIYGPFYEIERRPLTRKQRIWQRLPPAVQQQLQAWRTFRQ
jgi:hypothetical protein